MTRTILVLAVIGAFVLGSIATGTIAFAGNDDDDDDDFDELDEDELKDLGIPEPREMEHSHVGVV